MDKNIEGASENRVLSVMSISSSSFRRALLPLWLLATGPLATAAFAQLNDKPPPSPFTPGDLSKPTFDTTKRVYDSTASPDKSAGTVVAEVEGRAITLGDVGDAIRALPPSVGQMSFETLYPNILERLIRQQALVVRAQQQGIDEDPAVRRRVRAAADRELADQYLRLVISRDITEAALLERYNRDIAGRPGGEEVRIRLIVVGTEKEARDLLVELRNGADFATLARRASKDPTAAAGGDLGFNALDGLTPEVGAVAFALPVGQLAPYPVRSADAWFVVKLEERRNRPTPGFASVRDKLRAVLLHEGVEPATTAALADLNVRQYNLAGKEAAKASGP